MGPWAESPAPRGQAATLSLPAPLVPALSHPGGPQAECPHPRTLCPLHLQPWTPLHCTLALKTENDQRSHLTRQRSQSVGARPVGQPGRGGGRPVPGEDILVPQQHWHRKGGGGGGFAERKRALLSLPAKLEITHFANLSTVCFPPKLIIPTPCKREL